MKKLLILAAAVLSLSSVAQNKDEVAITKRLTKNDMAVADAKKTLQASTYLDRASIYIDAASIYTNKFIAGFDAKLLDLGDSIALPENVVLAGRNMSKRQYPNVNIYVSDDGILQYWEATKDFMPGALDKALENLTKTKSIDPKFFSNRAESVAGRLYNQYQTDGMNAYNLGKPAVAAKLFDGSYYTKELIGKVDTVSLYYAGVAYQESGDYKKSLERFEKALSFNYTDKGTVYYYIGACQEELGEKEKAIETFEAGFAKYPENQAILSGLINIYLETNKNADKLIEIVKKAQSLDPKNVSLYVVEGTVWDKLGNREKSEQAMDKAISIDPKNFTVFYNYGVLKIMQSDAIVTEANKLDVNDKVNYDRLIKESIDLQKIAIEKLEKAHEIDPNNDMAIDLLRQLYFPRRDDSPKMLERFNYFKSIQDEQKAK